MMKNTTALTVLSLAALALVAATSVGTVSADQNQSRAYINSYNVPSTGLALEGYCPVSYFKADGPVRGTSKHGVTYLGVTYHCADAEAKASFERNPEKYIPAYGGWCAFGMAVQDKFPVDPTNFKIVDGRLMVFLRNSSIDALELWNERDEPKQVQRADEHWKKVQG
jgi:YHS domain-containing protein